jgi:hypothetical protein
MSFLVGLYHDFARKGRITFGTMPASHPTHYDCSPEDVLNHDQAEHVSWQLCRIPAVCQEAVGKYVWRQEEV